MTRPGTAGPALGGGRRADRRRQARPRGRGQLSSYVRNAYHAIAIDERRKPFRPTLWERGEDDDQPLEQVWLAGVHCDVGAGGLASSTRLRYDEDDRHRAAGLGDWIRAGGTETVVRPPIRER